jgi:serpin B
MRIATFREDGGRIMRHGATILLTYATTLLISCLAAAQGCNPGKTESFAWGPLVPTTLEGEGGRDMDPGVPAGDVDALVSGNADFAFDLFHILGDGGRNVFFSPHSISTCLGMTYAGAENETEAQMAAALSYDLPEDRLHPAFNALDLALDARNTDDVRLSIVNDIWIQEGFPILPSFVELVTAHYGAGARLLDFEAFPEESRQTINNYVRYHTQERIEEILPEGSIHPGIVLVLTNAIYFKGTWKHEFDPADTHDRAFRRLDGTSVTVPVMRLGEELRTSSGAGWQALEIPYDGEDLAMLVILPDEERYIEVEASLGRDLIDEADAGLYATDVNLHMPRFTFETDYELNGPLRSLGMTDAFSDLAADFSGISEEPLFIDLVIHKAFVAVDEAGTEAAAATAVTMDGSVSMGTDFTMDRPFIFVIRDRPTGAILFLGRVLDPSA